MKPQYKIEDNKLILTNGNALSMDDVDDEMIEELNYDDSNFNECFDYLLKIENPLMQELYMWASNKMMSLDGNIGISYLFSYYYFKAFYLLLVKYHKGGIITEDDINMVKEATEYAEYEPEYNL